MNVEYMDRTSYHTHFALCAFIFATSFERIIPVVIASSAFTGGLMWLTKSVQKISPRGLPYLILGDAIGAILGVVDVVFMWEKTFRVFFEKTLVMAMMGVVIVAVRLCLKHTGDVIYRNIEAADEAQRWDSYVLYKSGQSQKAKFPCMSIS
ncbi:hypothetical protein BDZ45DRAFT_736530 [Acephala macrosclerotiorum]|nr:hypothetical protein BDZ45DRAFT_736530 [Acephala macrosclerotiorum]